MLKRLINRRFALLAGLTAAVCVLFLLWRARAFGLLPAPQPGTDQFSMLEAARQLADSGTLPGGDYRYSYLYTGFLALLWKVTGGHLIWMRALQGLLCALISPLLYHTTRLAHGGKLAGRIAALLYLFYAPALLISLDFLRAAPLALLFLGGVALLLRAGWSRHPALWCAAAGTAAGLAVLGRENFGAVFLLPLLAWFFPKFRANHTIGAALGYAAGAMVPVLAVMTANFCAFDSFQPVPGNAGNIAAFYFNGLDGIAAAAARFAQNLWNMLLNYEQPNSLSVYAHAEVVNFLKVFAVPFNLFWFLALAAPVRLRRRPDVWLITLLAAAYYASLVFFTPFYRFRIPGVPLLALLAGCSLSALVADCSRRRWKFPAALALAALLVFPLTTVAPDARRELNEQLATARLLVLLDRKSEAEIAIRSIVDNRGKQDPPLIRLLRKVKERHLNFGGDAL